MGDFIGLQANRTLAVGKNPDYLQLQFVKICKNAAVGCNNAIIIISPRYFLDILLPSKNTWYLSYNNNAFINIF